MTHHVGISSTSVLTLPASLSAVSVRRDLEALQFGTYVKSGPGQPFWHRVDVNLVTRYPCIWAADGDRQPHNSDELAELFVRYYRSEVYAELFPR